MLGKEEKIADGIYITKFNKDADKNIKPQYVYKTTTELIKLLEGEFEEIIMEIELLYNANEEMLEFDPKDYDLIQAREDNLVIINKRIERLNGIQNELRNICPTNPIVNINVFDYFMEKGKGLNTDKEDDNKIQQQQSEIIREIDL
jgi:hypothetical protein